MRYKKVAFLGLFTAAAILLGYVESLIPIFTTVPGMKVGLPNIAIVMVLYLYSWKEAALVSIIRIFINGLLFGNVYGFWLSLAGGVLSLLAMALLKKLGWFNSIGVSLVGGIMHNLGQILVAMAIFVNYRVIYYFIPLFISGLIAGVLIGLVGGIMVKRLAKVAPQITTDKKSKKRQEKEKKKQEREKNALSAPEEAPAESEAPSETEPPKED